MAEMGLGADSYLRVQKESTYGTYVSGAMVLLPVKEGTLISGNVANIENGNLISSRLKQAPNLGRKVNAGNIIMDLHPSLIGNIFNFIFGAASSSAVGDGAYNHVWLQDLDNERDGSIFSCAQALGTELEDGFVSGQIHKITIECDNEGNAMLNAEVVFKDVETDKPRITSFSYPSLVPFNFSQITFSEAGLGELCLDSLTIEIDLNYDIERYKIGDQTAKRVVFNGIPQCNITATIDADQQFIDAARAHTSYDLTIAMTGSDNAGSTPTKYGLTLEFPACRLQTDLGVEYTTERLKMELAFDCSYGGTTTNSGSDNVQFEVKLTDATASYTA